MLENYFDNSARTDRLCGGVRRIPIKTPHGTFKVWTKRVGNNPRIKLLLLHGGPGCTHEYFEACDSYLACAGIKNPRYMELLMQHHYIYHVLRMPLDAWPDPVERTFKHLNPDVYVPMQGPSELGASGKLARWDRTARLGDIGVPALAIGARHDTMDPAHMQGMARAMPRGRYLDCPEGSHLAMYDDQQRYFDGLIGFLNDVDTGRI